MISCVEMMYVWYELIFFFKQKTAYEMRISDWSSDVCSSDLNKGFVAVAPLRLAFILSRKGRTHAGQYSKSHSHESRKGGNRQGRRFGHHCSSCSNDRAASLCSRRHHHRRRHRGATAHKAAAQCGGTPCGRREKDDHRQQRRKAETGISAS